MDCQNVRSSMMEALDQEMNQADYERFKQHIESCSSCKEAFQVLLMIQETLLDEAEQDLPSDFHGSLMKKIKEESIEQQPMARPFYKMIPKRYLNVAAVFVFVVIFGVLGIGNLSRMNKSEEALDMYTMDSVTTESASETISMAPELSFSEEAAQVDESADMSLVATTAEATDEATAEATDETTLGATAEVAVETTDVETSDGHNQERLADQPSGGDSEAASAGTADSLDEPQADVEVSTTMTYKGVDNASGDALLDEEEKSASDDLMAIRPKITYSRAMETPPALKESAPTPLWLWIAGASWLAVLGLGMYYILRKK